MYAQNIFEDIKLRLLKGNNVVSKLILINIIVFIAFGILKLGFFLAGYVGSELYESGYVNIYKFFSISDKFSEFITRPWTILTYMFMHGGIGHIFWNLIVLFWFGNMFKDLYGNEKTLTLYILGGISGALLFLFAYQFIPVFDKLRPLLGMVGASASIVAIIVAMATLNPQYTINLLLVGPVKLIYLAIVLVAIYLISIPNGNAGGQIAHIGGAILGYFYGIQLKRGNDIGEWLSKLIFSIQQAFNSNNKQKRTSKSNFKTYKGGGSKKEPSTQGSTANNIKSQIEIDKILEKISRSGYDSLTDKEKDILFKASKK